MAVKGSVMVQMLFAYDALIKKVERDDPDLRRIGPLLSVYFQEKRRLLAADDDPFESFLQDPAQVVFPVSRAKQLEVYVPQTILSRAFHKYCTDNRIHTTRCASKINAVSSLCSLP